MLLLVLLVQQGNYARKVTQQLIVLRIISVCLDLHLLFLVLMENRQYLAQPPAQTAQSATSAHSLRPTSTLSTAPMLLFTCLV